MEQLYLRNYHKIFVGPPQKDGYQNIFLSYNAETTELIFNKDKTTYFHVPYFSYTTHINDSGFIEAGAIGGLTPYNSDKVFKKQGNYGKYTNYGNSTGPKDGEWLCSWLYLSSSEQRPVWLDRFYNPGHTSYSEAINQKYTPPVFIENTPAIFDLPSRLLLEPGSWYSFYHIGNKKIQKTIETISGDQKKLLTFTLEQSGTRFVDGSRYSNRFNSRNINTLIDFSPFVGKNSLDFSTNYLNTFVQYTTALSFDRNELGCVFWVSHNEWSQSLNSTLVGNLDKSSFEVSYENKNSFIYYTLSLVEQKKIAFFNLDNENYYNAYVEYTPQITLQDTDNNTIVVGYYDDFNSVIQKYDFTGSLLNEVKTPFRINDISLYPNNDFVIISDDRQHIYTKDFKLRETIFGTFINKTLFIDNNGKIFYFDVTSNCVTVDLNNNIYFARSRTVYKNNKRTRMTTSKTIHKIQVLDDQLWVLSGNNTMSVFLIRTEKLIRQFNFTNSEIQDRFANLLVTSSFLNGETKEYEQTETYNGKNRYFKKYFTKDTFGARIVRNLFVEWNTNLNRWEHVLRNTDGDLLLTLSYTQNKEVLEYPWEGVWNDPTTLITKYKTDRVMTKEPVTNFDFIKRYNRVSKKIETTILFVSNIENCFYEVFLDGNHKKDITLTGLFDINNFKYTSSFVTKKDITGYRYKQFKYQNDNFIVFKVKAYTNDYSAKIFETKINVNSFLDKKWYMVTCSYKDNTLKIYLNAKLSEKIEIPSYYEVPIGFKNNIFIGQPPGKTASINDELKTQSLQFNGYMHGIKLYSRALEDEDVIFLLKESTPQNDLYWNVNVKDQYYIEEIERFFKHRVPGSKSNFYNIKIQDNGVYSPAIREQIEKQIEKIINKTMPGYTQHYKVIWQ
jgi:hypothetical protein